ncbi:MAG: hypothetical protein BRC40_09455 [Cyanobacteria bacterium QH_8_48_120]|nr:MAG: hypothetical protein BRC40_09455 [Cyanobacteria bacterium QH_8_48_120]PSO73741.1 MAG: hypothetical protein BRC42_03720 [Cyanobacteria bacterium QS_1_48_34]PSP06927.1 MAG: hypothetical protein BRC54_06090 [Cyanobacteria bacterium SW_7_48_12]PSP31312.1 MAG: hypothetical protein BRC57_17240 [Cyanobacteria bacterium QS_8_48_54]
MSRVRIGELSQEMVEEVTRAFQADVAESYTVFALSRTDFEKAAEFLLQGNTGLRVGDALHLGIAYNHKTENLLSLDRMLITAARVLGISAGKVD